MKPLINILITLSIDSLEAFKEGLIYANKFFTLLMIFSSSNFKTVILLFIFEFNSPFSVFILFPLKRDVVE